MVPGMDMYVELYHEYNYSIPVQHGAVIVVRAASGRGRVGSGCRCAPLSVPDDVGAACWGSW